MKAVRIHEHGDEGVLRYEAAPAPAIGPDEVLVRVRAASINRGDLGRRSFGFMIQSLPAIIGWGNAGGGRACGVNGGGYAELAAAPAVLTVPTPAAGREDPAGPMPEAWIMPCISLLETARL